MTSSKHLLALSTSIVRKRPAAAARKQSRWVGGGKEKDRAVRGETFLAAKKLKKNSEIKMLPKRITPMQLGWSFIGKGIGEGNKRIF